jgi:hypothetical protein
MPAKKGSGMPDYNDTELSAVLKDGSKMQRDVDDACPPSR